MPIKILCAALLVLPLIGPVTLGPIFIPDVWKAKEFFSILFIMAIVGFSYKKAGTLERKPNNPFLIAILAFLPISAFMAPPIKLQYGFANLGGLWIWEGMAWVFAYFLLYEAICRMTITSRHQRMLAGAIGWGAVVSAGYAYTQALGLDQWQFTRPIWEIGNPLSARITAMMFNPTTLAIYMVMTLPFLMIYFRKWQVVFVVIAIIMCQSDIANVGMGLVLAFMFAMRAQRLIWIGALATVLLVGITSVALIWTELRPHIQDNGRFLLWEQVLEDWRSPCIKMAITKDMTDNQKFEIEKLNMRTYSLTGRGLNSFRFIFGAKYSDPYEAAHSEPIEGLYSIGLIGEAIFLLMIGWVLFYTFLAARKDIFILCLYVSLAFAIFASFGLHILHIEPLRLFSAAIFCLLSQNLPFKRIK